MIPPTPEQVREHRALLGLSQQRYGQLLGHGLGAVQHWEAGRRAMPVSTWVAYQAIGLADVREMLRCAGVWESDVI